VRVTPTWSQPVGDGAKRTRSGFGRRGVVMERDEKEVSRTAPNVGT
jgi:hypothetical protein